LTPETIKLTNRLRTEAGWHAQAGDLGVYLQPGDTVDETMEWYFLEVLPPETWTSDLIQIGEPYSHDAQGRALHRTGSLMQEADSLCGAVDRASERFQRILRLNHNIIALGPEFRLRREDHSDVAVLFGARK